MRDGCLETTDTLTSPIFTDADIDALQDLIEWGNPLCEEADELGSDSFDAFLLNPTLEDASPAPRETQEVSAGEFEAFLSDGLDYKPGKAHFNAFFI